MKEKGLRKKNTEAKASESSGEDTEKKEKEKPLSYNRIINLMSRIVKNHRNHTLKSDEKVYSELDIYFDEGIYYEYSILEKFYYSKAIFSKKGCYYFIHILELMQRHGINKLTREPLTKRERKKIGREIEELKEMVEFFNANPNFKSPYLIDRFAARDFKENLTYGAFKF